MKHAAVIVAYSQFFCLKYDIEIVKNREGRAEIKTGTATQIIIEQGGG